MPDSPISEEFQRAASDPATPQATLADLAYDYPELRAAIALNPSTYDGLLEWLRDIGDPEVTAALHARARGVMDASEPNVLHVEASASGPDLSEPVLPLNLAEPAPSTVVTTASSTPALAKSRFPAFMTRRFVIVIASIILVSVTLGIVVVTANTAALNAKASADARAQANAANKAHAANDSSSSAPTDTPSAATPTATPTPLPPPSIVPTGFTQTWSQGFVATGGYTETVAVSVGTPEALGSTYPRQVTTGTCSGIGLASSGCTSNTFTSGHTCTADKATDAVVPISVDMTSTTSTFSQIVGASLTFQSSSTLQYEAYYNSGQVCNDGSSGVLTEQGESTKPVKDGESTSVPIFLIIHNYYTPDHPSGDASLLSGINIYVAGSTNSSTSWTSDGKGITYQDGDAPSTVLAQGSPIQLG